MTILHVSISLCWSVDDPCRSACLFSQIIVLTIDVQHIMIKYTIMGGNSSHHDAPAIMLGDHFETFYLWSAFYTKQIWMDLQFKIHQICRVMILIMWRCQVWHYNKNSSSPPVATLSTPCKPRGNLSAWLGM